MISVLYQMNDDGDYLQREISGGGITGKYTEVGVLLDTDRWIVLSHGAGLKMLIEHIASMKEYRTGSEMRLHRKTALIFGKIPVKDINKVLLSRDCDRIKEFAEKYGLFVGINVSMIEKKSKDLGVDNADYPL